MTVTFTASEQYEIDTLSHAVGFRMALDDIRERIRDRYKYGTLRSAAEELDELRAFIAEVAAEYHLPESV